MRILALDTALDACAACVFDDDAGAIAAESLTMARGHAEALAPLVARVVAQGGGFEVLDRIAVTVGPGSFTGLRVAIAAGRAFALALGAPCIGVSTLAAIAGPHLREESGQAVAAAIDARHGQIYFQLFSARGRSLVEARCLPVREAARLLGTGVVKLAGPAAPLLLDEARAAGARGVVVDSQPAPDIVWVARLGLAADPQTARPIPYYLKPADATPQQGGRVARA
ncbi:tRNA (adenosine(37)-N6)-threonylcarbamoyltransferase complex dimerization subunit type 1 TsaB [Labrys wisconsinensis]|uniref:tRNA threonylcarbamoyl adenosine modification protein YeaZ n=1 Tax=Labrys wisconsinensis TaxID=425677 RepID=A0ABU0IZK7_9HYPH|nr:tRNA (adenosine(37)-N6)-threonylcarbamoyltransferase complex dimerization subunit type 1 TsaB [Labrys wisconsinensis]MDQ0467451.1 tRNA threonylcarbamoyl adenosine modification protein YeaZ [Labrys wisconsinensis]